MLPLFPLYLCLSLIHICSAANPSNAVSPYLLSLHPHHLPSPLSLTLSLARARCTGDVILFQLDSPPFSLLSRSHSLARFPLAAGSPQHGILSTVASLRGWEGEEECRCEVRALTREEENLKLGVRERGSLAQLPWSCTAGAL